MKKIINSLILTIIIIVLTMFLLKFFNVKFVWYYLILPYLLGSYIGSVIDSTLLGINISNIQKMKKLINSLIPTIIIIVLTMFLLKFFNVKFVWYYLILPYLLGSYIGSVINSTLLGFNISNIYFLNENTLFNEKDLLKDLEKIKKQNQDAWFLKESSESLRKWFQVEIVTDFKGTKKVLRGCYVDNLMEISTLKSWLSKRINQKKVIKKLENEEIYLDIFHFKDSYLEIIFTEIVLILKLY